MTIKASWRVFRGPLASASLHRLAEIGTGRSNFLWQLRHNTALADNVEEVAGLRASIPHAGAMLNLALDKLVIHWMSVEEDSRRTRIRPPEARPMARRFSKLGLRAVSLFCEDYENRDER